MVRANTSAPTPPSYVAILKCKQGELAAVSMVTPKATFVPLLEVVDPTKAAAIAKAWSTSDVVWIQPLNLSDTAEQDWASAVSDLFEDLRTQGVKAVPVVSIHETAAVYAAIAAVCNQDGRGAVLRLDCQEILDEGPGYVQSWVDYLTATVAVPIGGWDLVVDVGLVDGQPSVLSSVASSSLAAVPYIASWRNLVTAFSAFPTSVADLVAKSNVGAIPRHDAAAYVHLVGTRPTRVPTFGDYGVGVPTYADVPFTPVPNIRYAVKDEWIVHRGASRNNPSPQNIQLATDLVAATYFGGAAFSGGDQIIANTASGACGPGNPTTWLKVAMSRHFAVVLDSLATHGAP